MIVGRKEFVWITASVFVTSTGLLPEAVNIKNVIQRISSALVLAETIQLNSTLHLPAFCHVVQTIVTVMGLALITAVFVILAIREVLVRRTNAPTTVVPTAFVTTESAFVVQVLSALVANGLIMQP
jgi:hypothetical protein